MSSRDLVWACRPNSWEKIATLMFKAYTCHQCDPPGTLQQAWGFSDHTWCRVLHHTHWCSSHGCLQGRCSRVAPGYYQSHVWWGATNQNWSLWSWRNSFKNNVGVWWSDFCQASSGSMQSISNFEVGSMDWLGSRVLQKSMAVFRNS